jgi:hypothetical protein
MNLYAYVENDPVNKIDPLGLMMGDFGVDLEDAWQKDVNDVMRYNEEVKDWLDTLRKNMQDCCVDADFWNELAGLFSSIPPSNGLLGDLLAKFMSDYSSILSSQNRKCEDALRDAINDLLKKYPRKPQINNDHFYPPPHTPPSY